MTGNSDYVVLGGEFPTVNNVAQQGLVRFAKRPISPSDGPDQHHRASRPRPTRTSPAWSGSPFGSVWDRDDTTITYDVFRSPCDQDRDVHPQ